MMKLLAGMATRGLAVGLLMSALAATGMVVSEGTTTTASTCNASWTMYQHDARHTASGCSTIGQTTAPTLHQAWFDSTGGSAVTDEPVTSGGIVYFGDYGGTFYAVKAATGALVWRYSVKTNQTTAGSGAVQSSAACGVDNHSPSYGDFAGTATIVQLPGKSHATVIVGGGGTLYAFDAEDGSCIWSHNLDPTDPTSAMEIESSPVYDQATGDVIVDSDTNGGKANALPAVNAFAANDGRPEWSYSPSTTIGCDDLWASPALDTAERTVVFATGDCDNASAVDFPEAVIALNATSGAVKWVFDEPSNGYDIPPNSKGDNFDDDFGMSPIIVEPGAGGACPGLAAGADPIVVEGGKSGYIYEFDELTGKLVNTPLQVAQPGNYNVGPGSIGGFIGSAALGCAQDKLAVFLTSAVFSPFAQGGIQGASGEPGGVTTFPDTTVLDNPSRVASVHAYDVLANKVLWQAPVTTPVFGPATYSNGVVFTPSTTTFSAQALDADTGTQLWASPLLSAPSSGMSVAGDSVYFGAGTEFAAADGQGVPPQAYGVWSFTTDVGVPQVNQLATP